MADFCWDCVQELDVAPERNDMRHDQAGDLYTLCEGCGMGYFDREGKRVHGEPGGWLGTPALNQVDRAEPDDRKGPS